MKPVLYHSVSARSFRPLWAMEELGMEYELHIVPFPPRAVHRAYLEINPLGTVPALRVGNTLMTESAAMCQYLAEAHGGGSTLALTPDEPEYPDYLNYLHFGEATLTFPQTLVLRYRHFEAPERRSPQIVEDYARWFLGRLKALDGRLHSRPFLCGQRFTMADVSVGYAMLLAEHLDLLSQASTQIQAYWRSLQSRPAFQQALKIEHDAAVSQGVSPLPAPAHRPWEQHTDTGSAQ